MTRLINVNVVGNKRRAVTADLQGLQNSTVSIVNSGEDISISKTAAVATASGCIFHTNIRSIEFKFPSPLADGTTHSIIIGEGTESATTVYAYIAFRSDSNGFFVYNVYSPTANLQAFSFNGGGRMSSPYLDPENVPGAIAVGDTVRLTLLDDNRIYGQIKRGAATEFSYWFIFDRRGLWCNPVGSTWASPTRYGWNSRLRFGMVKTTGTAITTYTAFDDLYVWDKKDESGNDLPFTTEETNQLNVTVTGPANKKPKWVAIGDSITGIDENNGKSYVSFANSILNYDVVNRGFGGWTIYKLWRDRVVGDGSREWPTTIATADIVTIFAGTNDFNTDFYNPSSDADMDANAHPHPRFGETDPTHVNAKDPHTTLGCLRLMIENILTTNPKVKLFIATPLFRLMKTIVTGGALTRWPLTADGKPYNAEGKTIYDYANAIAGVAREYNLPVIDLINDLGINALNISNYMYDELHLNEEGGKIVGIRFAQKIRLY
jgi:lysophospholipase L1-like esterase